VRRMSVRVLREMADVSSGLGRNAFLSTVRLFGFIFLSLSLGQKRFWAFAVGGGFVSCLPASGEGRGQRQI
jgi:hypothetical protein